MDWKKAAESFAFAVIAYIVISALHEVASRRLRFNASAKLANAIDGLIPAAPQLPTTTTDAAG